MICLHLERLVVMKLYTANNGCYIHNSGAQYSAPLFSNNKFPTLLELHRSQHEYLALANLSDAVGRLYGGVVLSGADSLKTEHRQQADRLFAALYNHTCRTHELVATYLSFVMFRANYRDEAEEARKSLAAPYAALLQFAEAAFGSIDDPQFHGGIFPVIMACAIAALNPPFPDDVAKFEYLPECAEFIVRHSPDDRFETFLRQLRPPWEPGSVMANAVVLDPEEAQAAMFATLRSIHPEIEFVTFAERPTRFREWAQALINDGQKYSYHFLDSFQVKAHPPDTAISRLGGQVEMPGLTPGEPRDLSLISTGYAKGSPPELSAVAHACVEQDATAFWHVFASTERNDANVLLFALDSDGHQVAIPIAVALPLDELVQLLAEIPPRHLVVKIDDRWGEDATRQLVTTGHPVFRLPHDTSPANINEFIRIAANEQNVSLTIQQLSGGPGFSVCAYLHQDRYALLAPATELGAELLYKELHEIEAVSILRSKDSIPELLKIDVGVFEKTLTTCFVQGPAQFDHVKDHAHLLRGIYT